MHDLKGFEPSLPKQRLLPTPISTWGEEIIRGRDSASTTPPLPTTGDNQDLAGPTRAPGAFEPRFHHLSKFLLTILIVSAGFIFGFIMASRTSLYSGITAAGLADAIGELSSTEGLQQNLYPAIFAAADAVGYSHLHKNDQATSSAQASDRLRIKVHREIIRISTNTADLDVMNKELKEAVKYVAKTTRFRDTFFSKHEMEYSPVTSANNFAIS